VRKIIIIIALLKCSAAFAQVVGCNFIPSSAINQLEMWQKETFDTATISRELKLASSIGMNVIRVYLHDLVYKEDPADFLKRIDIFLTISNRYGIKTIFVFFDSCWDPFPFSGKQPAPVPFRHNSHWVQSPGYIALSDSTQYARLESYIKAVVKQFARDNRIFAWDVWNEPDFTNEDNSYGKEDLPGKDQYVLSLLRKAFAWVRSVSPAQPVTSGIWKIYGNWSTDYKLSETEQVQIENSDIISFHYYGSAAELKKRIVWLKQFNRPVICTEYLARTYGSSFEDCLPVFLKYNAGAINWGLVSGKTQTIFPWDSWNKNYSSEPAVWHHDIFRKDGSPYDKREIEVIRQATKK
jgi:endo-1,4-beta-mannosidase